MSSSRPYFEAADPTDDADAGVYDAVALMLSRHLGFRRGLTEVAGFVCDHIAGADGAGVALAHDGQQVVRVASSPLVNAADDVQYGLDEGPCLTAVAERRTVSTGSLGGHDERWPRFAHGVRHLGIESVLSLPLVVRAGVVGSLNIYGLRGDAFAETDTTRSERFARPVAAAIHSANVSQHLDELAAQLFESLHQHALVAAAVGFLRRREGIGPEDARRRLDELAVDGHQSVTQLAEALVRDRGPSADGDQDMRSSR